MFTKRFVLAACSAIVAIVFAQKDPSQYPPACTGDGCNKDCGGPSCAMDCIGDECGEGCEGSYCAIRCKGKDCGKWCGRDTSGQPVSLVDGINEFGGYNCASQCESVGCGACCKDDFCASQCEGDGCGAGCDGFACAMQCKGDGCGDGCTGSKCADQCVDSAGNVGPNAVNPDAQCGCGADGAVNTCTSTVDTCVQPTWQAAMNGCCREHVPGRKRGNPPVISKETIDGGTMADAIDTCKQLCNGKSTCTAVEVRPIKKTRWNKINKKNKKKTSKGFACELHSSINASSRKNKSCKKAKCFTMDQSE